MTKLSRSVSWFAPILLAAGSLTCGGDLASPHSDPVAMRAVLGDGQAASIETELPEPLVILVTDIEGRPVPGVSVSWEVRDGGSISDNTVSTNNEGRAAVRRTLGATKGAQTTVATVSGLTGSPVTFTANALSAGSGSLALTTLPPPTVLEDDVFGPSDQPSVRVLDPDGAPIANQPVIVTLGSGSGTLRGQTTANTNGSGVATFFDLGIDGTGAHTLKFTAGALTAQSSPILVTGLPPEASTGKWSPTVTWPIVPLHMHVLPNGNVLAWGREKQPWVWTPPANDDPAGAGSLVEVPVDTMLFCAGHAFMPDGRLMVSGGHLADDRGLATTYFFTASGASGTWDNAGGAQMMAGRWYPTVTILPNGRALTMAGRDSQSNVVAIPEVWDGTRWVKLSSAFKKFPYYPRNFVAPDGRLFYAGEHIRTWWLNTSGNGSWTQGPLHKWARNRDYGAAVMYDNGKIMYVGGGGDPSSNAPHDPTSSQPTETAEIIDLNASTPEWEYTGSMEFPRRHLNATVLPDGEVLVTGGVASGGALNNLSQPTRAAEIWNPGTGHWTTLASSVVPRGYHAVSVLMPNGLVLHGASGDANAPDGSLFPAEKSHEMFQPPYFFKGTRPTITSVPTSLGYGQPFTVETPFARQITTVAWIRLPSTTHAFDANQRRNTLPFTQTAGGISVTPPDRNNAPPGHYILFLVKRNGVPSLGKIVQIE